LRPHGAAGRLRRIGRLLRNDILEEIAHASKMGRRRGSFNVFDARFAERAEAFARGASAEPRFAR
jgi:hypothetical protein